MTVYQGLICWKTRCRWCFQSSVKGGIIIKQLLVIDQGYLEPVTTLVIVEKKGIYAEAQVRARASPFRVCG
jgi:hypothetical protein